MVKLLKEALIVESEFCLNELWCGIFWEDSVIMHVFVRGWIWLQWQRGVQWWTDTLLIHFHWFQWLKKHILPTTLHPQEVVHWRSLMLVVVQAFQALSWPFLVQVTLLESLQKRCDFLEHVIKTVGLPNVQIVHSRAEVRQLLMEYYLLLCCWRTMEHKKIQVWGCCICLSWNLFIYEELL
jgi:hypothetical protein